MVKIPTPAQQGQPVGSVQTQAANTPFIQASGVNPNAAFAQDMDRLGQSMQVLGVELTRRRAEDNLMQAEKEVFEWKKRQYDPKTGLATQQGGNAAGVTDQHMESFSELSARLQDTYGTGVGRSGKKALEQLLANEERKVWNTAANYETQQLEVNAQRLNAAAMDDLEDIAVYSLYYGETDDYIGAIEQITNRAEDEGARLGYTGKALEQYTEQARSKAIGNSIVGLANSGKAVDAVAMLDRMEAEGKVDESDAISLRNQIVPMAEDEEAQTAASQAFAASSAPPGSTPMGQPTVDTIMPALIFQESGFGFGSGRTLDEAVSITSSAGAVGLTQIMPETMAQPGMGVRPYAFANGVPEGTPAEVVAREQRRFGQDYLTALVDKYDGNMQMALYAYNWGAGNVDAWIKTGRGVNGQEMPQETADYAPAVLARAGYHMRAGGANEPAVVADDTMTVRDRLAADHGPKAVAKFDDMVAADHTRMNRAKSAAYSQIVGAVDQLISSTGSADLDLILSQQPELRQILGDKIIPLREYVNKRNKGEDIVTDPSTFGALVTLKETDPDMFARVNLLDPAYLNSLSRSDLKAMQVDQAEMRGGSAPAAVDYTTVNRAIGGWADSVITGSERTNQKAKIVHSTRSWALQVAEQTGTPPSDLQMLTFAEKALMEDGGSFSAEIDPKGLGNKVDEQTFTAAADRIDSVGIETYLTDPEDLELTLPSAAGEIDVRIPQPERQRIFNELQLNLGRRPTGADFLTALMLQYTDVFNP